MKNITISRNELDLVNKKVKELERNLIDFLKLDMSKYLDKQISNEKLNKFDSNKIQIDSSEIWDINEIISYAGFRIVDENFALYFIRKIDGQEHYMGIPRTLEEFNKKYSYNDGSQIKMISKNHFDEIKKHIENIENKLILITA